MKSDRAHRTLNTVLLATIMAMISAEHGGPATNLMEATLSLIVALLLGMVLYLGYRVATRYPDEVRNYIGA